MEKVKPDRDTGGLFSNTTEKTAKKTRKAASKTIDKGIDKGIDKVSDKAGIPKPNKLARKLAAKALKAVLKRAAESGSQVVRAAADRAVDASKEAEEKIVNKRPPVQASVDVAVPIRVAWGEWENFALIPEGTHTVSDIERDGDTLSGQVEGVTSSEWEAEILDEREQESFAWQSHAGSDCAGLITFHELADRLTRLELNLDIVPTNLVEMISLATHRADHKAEADLRRFKAHLELIDPDVYEEDEPPEPRDEEEPGPTDEEPQGEDEDDRELDDDEENLDDEDEDFDDSDDQERIEEEQAA